MIIEYYFDKEWHKIDERYISQVIKSYSKLYVWFDQLYMPVHAYVSPYYRIEGKIYATTLTGNHGQTCLEAYEGDFFNG